MIAFAHGFPTGQAESRDDRRRLGHLSPRSLDLGQRLAILGSALLGGSVCLPFLSHPRLMEGQSLWQQEMSYRLPLATSSLLVLAIVSLVVAWRRWYVVLWLSGFAAYMALVLGFLLCLYLASIAPNPLGIDPSPELVEFRIGWYVAVAGILLLFAGAVVDAWIDSRRNTLAAAVEPEVPSTGYWYFIHSYRGGGPGEG
jgi:pilus assembly protein TadC